MPRKRYTPEEIVARFPWIRTDGVAGGGSADIKPLFPDAGALVSSSLSNAPIAELVVRVHLWKAFIEQLGDYPAALGQSEAIARIGPTRTTIFGSVGPVFTLFLAVV